MIQKLPLLGEWMNDECLEPNQLLAEECTAHAHTYIYICRHVSAHIHTYDAWPTSHAQYTQHTYTHACIHALMHQCIHIKAIHVCISHWLFYTLSKMYLDELVLKI